MKDAWRIHGVHEGKARLLVKDSKGAVLDWLEIRVLRQRVLSVQFFLVSDKAKHTTRVTKADVESWVDDANKDIFEPQLNLTFKVTSVKPHSLPEDLGKVIDLGTEMTVPYVPKDSDGHKRWHRITDPGDKSRDVFNVFCVWDFQLGGLPAPEDGFVQSKVPTSAEDVERSRDNANMCIIKDLDADDILSGTPFVLFAHEAGHYLRGWSSHHPDTVPGNVLMRGDGMIGSRLLKDDFERVARRFP